VLRIAQSTKSILGKGIWCWDEYTKRVSNRHGDIGHSDFGLHGGQGEDPGNKSSLLVGRKIMETLSRFTEWQYPNSVDHEQVLELMGLDHRLPYQAHIPAWMVNHLNRSVIQTNSSYGTPRVYWEQVEAYPEVMMTRKELSTCFSASGWKTPGSHGEKWLRRQSNWRGCLRVAPFSTWGKYKRCQWKEYEQGFCKRHLPWAIKDAKAVSNPEPTNQRPSWFRRVFSYG